MRHLFYCLILISSCSNPKTNTTSKDVLQKESQNIIKKNCTCITLWMPVCGEDKKTYSNSCLAECSGIKYKQGSCEDHLE